MDYVALVNEASELLPALYDDVIEAAEVLKKHDSQYNRRSFVRAVFASVEAITFVIKLVCVARPDLECFSEAEIALLREQSYSLTAGGQPLVQTKFLPMDSNFRFAIQMFMKGIEGFDLDLGDGGWQAFKKAIQIRHRITHPKNVKLLHIEDDELQTIDLGYSWVNRMLIKTSLINIMDLRGKIKSIHDSIAKAPIVQSPSSEACQPKPSQEPFSDELG